VPLRLSNNVDPGDTERGSRFTASDAKQRAWSGTCLLFAVTDPTEAVNAILILSPFDFDPAFTVRNNFDPAFTGRRDFDPAFTERRNFDLAFTGRGNFDPAFTKRRNL
jgi:hypothetical protein